MMSESPGPFKPALDQDTCTQPPRPQRQLDIENHLLSAPQKIEGRSLPKTTTEAGRPLAPAFTFSSTLWKLRRICSFFRQLTVVAALRPGVSVSVEKGKEEARRK